LRIEAIINKVNFIRIGAYMAYSESDTRSKLIDPRIKDSDWLESNIVREYYFTDGRKLIGGKRGKIYFVDYLLTYKNTNLAIIEAKAESKDPLDGLQQSINYAQRLKIDYVYTTNGHKIYEHSLKDGKGRFIENYPTPDELFERKYSLVGFLRCEMSILSCRGRFIDECEK